MKVASLVALVFAAASGLKLPPSPTSRRSALSSCAAALTTISAVPAAHAKSKKKAAEEATQKETAKEARQAMREYKYAPRPELIGNAKDGYSFKEGTVTAGSQGELASYFTEKGAKIQATYQADKAKASGLTSEQAKKVEEETLKKIQAERAAKIAKSKELSEDAKKIKANCEKNPNLLDEYGRRVC